MGQPLAAAQPRHISKSRQSNGAIVGEMCLGHPGLFFFMTEAVFCLSWRGRR